MQTATAKLTVPMLTAAFIAARDAALAHKDDPDNGTCNRDTPVLRVPPGTREATILAAAEAAGISASKIQWLGRVGYFIFAPSSGQASRCSRMAEAACGALKDAGLEAIMWYQMD
jgi:hypothetical protein